jgi:DNA-binding NtrC family response regulator
LKSVSIMIVENNSDLRNTLQRAFEDRGYLTWTCRAPEIAVSIFETVQPSIVILDLDFEGADLLKLLDSWHEHSPQTRVIVESANSNADRVREVMRHGALAFLAKPYSLVPLFHLLENGIPPSPPVTKAA